MRFVPCLLLAACAAAAPAAITLIEETRYFSIFAQGNSDFGGDQGSSFGYGSDSNDDPLVAWLVSDDVNAFHAQSAVGSASGLFLMDIDPVAFLFLGTLEGSATVYDETGHDAEGSGSALMQVTFSLAQASEWRLRFDASGTTEVSLVSGVNGPQVFDFGAGSVDQNYLLDAGTYTLTFASSAYAVTFVQGTVNAASAITASFALVPAPGTLALLALAAPAARRRRR